MFDPALQFARRSDLRTLASDRRSDDARRRAFLRIFKSIPRPNPDPHLEWHLELFTQYTAWKRRLEKLVDKPIFSDQELKELNIIHGPELYIDDGEPIDLEPRFFAAASSEVGPKLAQRFRERGCEWAGPHKKRHDCYLDGRLIPNHMHVSDLTTALMNLSEWDLYLPEHRRSGTLTPWFTSCQTWGGNPTKVIFSDIAPFRNSRYNEFHLADLLTYCGKGCSHTNPNPAVSHAMAAIVDTFVPDQRILRSELLLAVMLLRHNLGRRFWPTHHTFPILLLSLHEGGGRILQIHARSGQLHVRASRLLDLQSSDEAVPHDGLLAARWMLANPIGNTVFSDMPCHGDAEDQILEDRDSRTPWTLTVERQVVVKSHYTNNSGGSLHAI